jgi:hypothetical protein
MSDIVFRKIGTEETLPYSTLRVKRTKTVEVEVNEPLWDATGKRLSVDQLAAIGYEVLVTPEQSAEYIEWHYYDAIYTANEMLATRVIEYKNLLDSLGITDYNATTETVEAAIKTAYTDPTEQLTIVEQLQATLLNIKVNYQAIDGTVNDFMVWSQMSLLVKYLPAIRPGEPAYIEPYVMTSAMESSS